VTLATAFSLQREVIRKKAEGSRNGFEATAGLSKGSTRSDEGFRASDCAHVFRAPEDDRGRNAFLPVDLADLLVLTADVRPRLESFDSSGQFSRRKAKGRK
jgi:hypothetical protein